MIGLAGLALGSGSGWLVSQAHTGSVEVAAGVATPAAADDSVPRVSAFAVAPAAPQPLPSVGFDDAQFSIDDPESPWVVVNKRRPLDPDSYEPGDLQVSAGVGIASGAGMRAEAAEALASMEQAAKPAGVTFRISSAFRSWEAQAGVYDGYVRTGGVAQADTFSARPGYSEHQTGWAVDLYDSAECRLKACFGDSPSGQWIAVNAADFGFITRYPEGASQSTGYKYEPWHLRYVGVVLAQQMRDSGVHTLEEFFGLPGAPDYTAP